jgi:hypothetical protein
VTKRAGEDWEVVDGAGYGMIYYWHTLIKQPLSATRTDDMYVFRRSVTRIAFLLLV